MGSFKLIKPFINKYKFYLVIYTICVLLSYPLESIIIPKLFSSFIENIKTEGMLNNDFIFNFFKKIIIFITIVTIAHSITTNLDIYLIPEFTESINNQFFENILIHYQNNYTDLELGKILSRINGLPSILREVTTDLFNWVVPKLLTIIVINGYFLYVNKTLGLASISLLLVTTLLNISSFKPCIDLSNKRYLQHEDKVETLQDKLSNLYSIYSSGNINEEIKEFENVTHNFKNYHRKSLECSYNLKKRNAMLVATSLIVLSVIISYLFIKGKLNDTRFNNKRWEWSFKIPTS